MATHGGKRQGAGKPKGKLSAKTLEKQKVQEAFNQRVLKHADSLFEAQFQLAVGSVRVFQVVETGKGANVKREHVLVTNPKIMKDVLDEIDGEGGGKVGEDFYFVTAVPPSNQAIDSMLNRTLGKAKESLEHSGEVGVRLVDASE